MKKRVYETVRDHVVKNIETQEAMCYGSKSTDDYLSGKLCAYQEMLRFLDSITIIQE